MIFPRQKKVAIVVMGDIGHSPRMQYQATSIAELGHNIGIIGYLDSKPIESIQNNPLIKLYHVIHLPAVFTQLMYFLKPILQTFHLLFLLFWTGLYDIVLVQNPPAIPALIVCWLYCRLTRGKLIIDWHNYSYSILAMKLGSRNILVSVTKFIETFIGKHADVNFCVTYAMRNDLKKRWNIVSTTLYDRPTKQFRPITAEERKTVFETLKMEYKEFDIFSGDNRVALIVTSTSYTDDEDLSMLISALEIFETSCRNGNIKNLPFLLCCVTGKGPNKAKFENMFKEYKWKFVKIITVWLHSMLYPQLLAAADAGISLHTSSSKLDLPMKIVDMFGCGLPVFAFKFHCLDELLQHNENGFVFESHTFLATYLINWFENFPHNPQQKEIKAKFKEELQVYQTLGWSKNWNNVAASEFI